VILVLPLLGLSWYVISLTDSLRVFCDSNLQVYLERILRKPEIDAFAEELRPHQVSETLYLAHYMFFLVMVLDSLFAINYRKLCYQISPLCLTGQ
jgi:hypothetical protein